MAEVYQGKKVPRDAELKRELQGFALKHQAALKALQEEVTKARKEILCVSLAAGQANHAVKSAGVAKERVELEKTQQRLTQAQSQAISAANKAYTEASREAVKAFELRRDGLEVEVAAKNKPIEDAYKVKDAVLVAKHSETVDEATKAFMAECAPLQEELTALALALAEKAKKRQEAEATKAEVPTVEAPPV